MKDSHEEDLALKEYYGHAGTAERPIYVTSRDAHGPSIVTHHIRHSLKGFGWDSSDRQSDLARSLLLDSFGALECAAAPLACQCENKWVEMAYAEFREKVISTFTPDEDWRYDQTRAMDFAFDFAARHRDTSAEELVPSP